MMAGILSIRANAEEFDVDPNVAPLMKMVTRVFGNPYSEQNPEGVVDLGIAVNSLVHEMITEKLMSIYKDIRITSEMMNYSSTSDNRLKQALVGYLGNVLTLSRTLTSENVYTACGVGSSLDCLMHLICDPGDGIILPTPCYGMFKADCSFHAKVKLVLVSKTSNDPVSSDVFKPTIDDYESAYVKATEEGVRVRGVLVTNPHNPIGYVLTKEELRQLVQFSYKHSIHLIVDEIYMKSLVNPEAKFTSVLELEDIPNPDLVHVVWGPSKDFGIPGFRIGFLISCGTAIPKAFKTLYMHVYYAVNKIALEALATMLSDWDWLSKVYFPTQMELSQKALKIVTDTFDDIGVPYIKPDAGLFVYTDLRKYTAKLSKDPREGELALFERFVDNGVYLASGSTLCMSEEYGWFRPIFTVRIDHLEVGMKRVCKILKDIDDKCKLD